MKILFLTILRINKVSERGLYNDLIREFKRHGHEIFVACPSERRYNEKTTLINEEGVNILKISTLNLQKTNVIEKGLGTLLLEMQFLKAIKQYYLNEKFDLVLYSTPPITFTRVIEFIKKRDQARSYLLLKDIFPQNAVDLGMFKNNGLIHRFFKKREKELYAISDYIGCMSPANVEFLKSHHKELNPAILEVNPNSIDPIEVLLSLEEKINVRRGYAIPMDATVFLYGGNLGKPQGIDFLIDVLKSNFSNLKAFFLIVGSGTEFPKLKTWFEVNRPKNAILIPSLPKIEYDHLIQSCDVGLIFLDKRFTIPNFPSRLLSYMECKLPVIAATDVNTDIGKIIEANNFGFWCENGDIQLFNERLTLLIENRILREELGANSLRYLKKNYIISHSYKKIIDHFNV